ncbi:MAG TPA: helix-turn-helix transcriptional regulator, partial [Chloroflexota bacterium]|nr:helix-turn-helix transcriptional regulator [Chloroflexota bacterium]
MSAMQIRTFAELIKQYRLAAGFTQEELAERAHVSVRAVSDLERGVKSRPYPATIRLLADALQLAEAERTVLEVAAGRRSGAAPAVASDAHEVADALWPFWRVHSYLSEGRRWLAEMLAIGPAAPSSLRAGVLHGAGTLAYHQGDNEQAAALHQEALTLYRALGNSRGIARTLNELGSVAQAQGDLVRASTQFAESLLLFRELDDAQGIADVLNNLGSVAESQRQYEQARSLYEQSLVTTREIGDTRGTGVALHNLGSVADRQGYHQEALALYLDSLVICRRVGDRTTMASSLERLVEVASALQHPERAAQLGGAAAALR